jgi:DNA-binding NarL/FixJ family response regulator
MSLCVRRESDFQEALLQHHTMNPISENQNRSHRLVLIDELSLYRRGVAELVRRQEGWTVCGEYSDRNSALAAMDSLGADLVIMELSTRDGAGVDLIKDLRLRHARLRILVLSQYPETIHAERVLQAGAFGFVSKFEEDSVILQALHCVLEGRTYFSAKVSAQLALRYLGVGVMETASPIQGLTNRELQVFRLIGSGKPTRGVATALGLSVKTIETYLEHLKRKLGVTSGVALTHRAVQWMERGMVD